MMDNREVLSASLLLRVERVQVVGAGPLVVYQAWLVEDNMDSKFSGGIIYLHWPAVGTDCRWQPTSSGHLCLQL